jgi:hypothetical protein
MPVRVPHVHLADVPRHVGRWEGDVQPGGHALLVDLVHVVNHTDIQTPLSAVWSPSGPNVEAFAPLPRPPWRPAQRKISHSPDPTDPKVGGVPQSQHFLQPHFPNQAKLAEMSETFSMGVTCFAFIPPKDSTPIKAALEKAGPRGRSWQESKSKAPHAERRMGHPAF